MTARSAQTARNMRRHSALAGAFLAAALAFGAPAHADVLVSNSGQANGGRGSLQVYDQAQAFTTGNVQAGYTFTSVEIQFEDVTETEGFSSEYAVSLWSNGADGFPGGWLGALTGPVGGAVADVLNTYTASGSGIKLAKGATYFIVIDSSSGGSTHLQNTASDNEDTGGADGWSIANGSIYKDRGTAIDSSTTWRNFEDSKEIRINGTVNAASSDASLSDLSLSGVTLDPVFASVTTAYTAEVANAVARVTVTPVLTDAFATLEYLVTFIGYNDGDATLADADSGAAGHQVNLAVGETTIKVKVTATDGTTVMTYTVKVTRAALRFAAVLSGDVLVSNIGQTREEDSASLSGNEIAQGFETGSNAMGYLLTRIEVAFGAVSTTGLTATLHKDSPSAAAVATLSGGAAGVSAGVNAFTAPAGTVLDKDSTYFIALKTATPDGGGSRVRGRK